jgi:hypothetical protein
MAFTLLGVLVGAAFATMMPFSPPLVQKAYADGLTMENLPPTSLQGRQASLFVKVNPPILTSAARQNTFMQFRLFDANNNQTFKWVTYNIEVTKGIAEGGKPILQDFFQAPNGLLTLKIEPSPGQIVVSGNQDPYLNAWVADPGGTVNIRGPLLLDGGLYHFHITIFAIDNPRGILANTKSFDSWLSVGDVSNENLPTNGQNYNATIISYYDKIQNFQYDPTKKTLTWSMPFDWNASRIQKNNIFVHEEVRIPKTLPGLGDSPYYNATANGELLTGRKLALDPYSFQSAMTLHYLLNKQDILQMASKVNSNGNGNGGGASDPSGSSNSSNNNNNNNTSGAMNFTLSPASQAPAQTTGEMVTDTGGIGVAVQWSPRQLDASKQSTVNLRFSDAFTGTSLNSDVLYNLNIIDSTTGKTVYTKDNLTAKGGTDNQTINFPSNAKYNVQVAVKGLTKPGQQVDQTRNGVARGVVVVPEFPTVSSAAITLVVLGLIIGTLSIATRRQFRLFGGLSRSR